MLSTLPSILNSPPLPAAEGAAARVDREAHTGFAVLMQQQADLRSAMLRKLDLQAQAPRPAGPMSAPAPTPRTAVTAAPAAAAPAPTKTAEPAPRAVQEDPPAAGAASASRRTPERSPTTTAAPTTAPQDDAEPQSPAAEDAAADPASPETTARSNNDSAVALAARSRLAGRNQAAGGATPSSASPTVPAATTSDGQVDLGTETLTRDLLPAPDVTAMPAAPDPAQVPTWLQGQALVTGWRPTPATAALTQDTTRTATTDTTPAAAVQPTAPGLVRPDVRGPGRPGSAVTDPLSAGPANLRGAADDSRRLATPDAMGPATAGAAAAPLTVPPEPPRDAAEAPPLTTSAALNGEASPAWRARPQGLPAAAAEARVQVLTAGLPATGSAAGSASANAVMAARAGSTAGLPAVARSPATPLPSHGGAPASAQATAGRKASKADETAAASPDAPAAGVVTADPQSQAASPAPLNAPLPNVASPNASVPGTAEAAAGQAALTPTEGLATAATRGMTNTGLPLGPNALAADKGRTPALAEADARRHTDVTMPPDPLALVAAAASSAVALAPVASAAVAAGLRLGSEAEGRPAPRQAADSDSAPVRTSRLPSSVDRNPAPIADERTGGSQGLFGQRPLAESVQLPAGPDRPRSLDDGAQPPLPGAAPAAAAPALAAAAAARAAQAEPLAAAVSADTVRAIEPGAPSMATPVLASGSAPAATTLAGLPTGAAPAPAEGSIPVPLDSPAFAPTLGAQISLFARDGVQTARLQLNPAEMGPITVQIALDGSAARVDFQADLASTRAVIEASLPALARALQEAGMTLAGGGVSQQPSSHQPPPQADPSGAQRRTGDRSTAAGDAPMLAPVAARTRGLVDLVA